MVNCVFCKIVDKKLPASVEYEDESVLAFKSIEPVSEFHILVIPKKHIPTFMDIKDDVILKMTKASQEIVRVKKIINGYKLVFNGGIYQAIPHLHWHLLGGKFFDDNDILNKT